MSGEIPVPDGADTWKAPTSDELPDVQPAVIDVGSQLPHDVSIPEGFEYPRHFSSEDRYAEDKVTYSRTAVLRRDAESQPELPPQEVGELVTILRRIAVLDD